MSSKEKSNKFNSDVAAIIYNRQKQKQNLNRLSPPDSYGTLILVPSAENTFEQS